MRRFAVPGVAVLLAAGLVALLIFGVASEGDSSTLDGAVAKGKRPAAPARDQALPALGGGPDRTLADFGGKVVVLNVFASWCDPCKTESPALERTFKAIGPKGGTVVGVTWRDTTDDATRFARRYGLSYPILRDVSGDFARAFGVAQVPETFVLDRDGRVVALRRGPVDPAWVNQVVLPLLRS